MYISQQIVAALSRWGQQQANGYSQSKRGEHYNYKGQFEVYDNKHSKNNML